MSTLIDISTVENALMIFLETPAVPRDMGVSNASGRSVINDKHVAYVFPVATYRQVF